MNSVMETVDENLVVVKKDQGESCHFGISKLTYSSFSCKKALKQATN